MTIRSILKWPVWALFGNDEDGPLGDSSWNPERLDTWGIRIRWWLRNPAHNWTFHVIGVAGKPFTRTGRYPADVFSPVGGWNFCVTRYKWLRLPFVSYSNARFKTYFGWRDRGNFGLKLNIKLRT